MIKKRRIANALYKKILQAVPISTVDLVVVRGYGKNREFLLGKRRNKPYKEKWFIPGGRILWGESLTEAVQRHLKGELGLHSVHFSFVSHYSFENPPGEQGVRYFALLHIYRVEIGKGVEPRPDKENSEFAWFKKIYPSWLEPLQQILKIAGL